MIDPHVSCSSPLTLAGSKRATSARRHATHPRALLSCATMQKSSASANRNATKTYVVYEATDCHLADQTLQFKMKRNPRKLAWTKAFRRAHGKEMTVDSTLAFAQRRNIPVRYNRELVAKTLEAMQRVSEIRARRERQFYKNRMKGNREKQLEADRKLVAENQHLLPPQYRDQVQQALEQTVEPLVEEMELEEELTQEQIEKDSLAPTKQKSKAKGKKRLIVGHGVEDMDVDN